MARASLWIAIAMRTRTTRDCRCSYVVIVENAATPTRDLRELASYLSTLTVSGCDVAVLDPSTKMVFELNSRTLRWVARHIPVRAEHRSPAGSLDRVRAACAVALCEKVMVATEDVRYTPEAIAQMCDLLELHEAVEPQDYLDPLPWWGSIEAGRILVHRGIEPQPDHGATFGFRRSALRNLRTLSIGEMIDDPTARLAAAGADVFAASDVFVRREPGALDDWIEQRPRAARFDFALPIKSLFFFSLVPLLLLLGTLGGPRLAGIYAGMIVFSSMGLALRGRSGASPYFPLRACLYAPLWVLERSISVYWALFRKLRGAESDPARAVMPDRARGTRVASGE
ncbi:MAG TPA: hypothetical protein VEK79_21530 [Thermoanaerobaculia bacterium]|nr:hypothetical protein [Thermoanaerobaculia bacterium]